MALLGDERRSGAGFVLPVWWQNCTGLVVPCQTVDTGFDENETELGITILAVALQVLADAHGLLDQVVDVLWQIRGQSLGLENAKNLVSSDETNLGNTVTVSKDDTDLRWGQTLLGQLEDLVLDILGCELEPGGHCSAVGEGRLGNTLAWCVHTTHGEDCYDQPLHSLFVWV